MMKKMMTATVHGAYGRDYSSSDAAEYDLRQGLDFTLREADGIPVYTYCSIRDMDEGCIVEIRYNKMRSVVMVKI